MLTRRASFAPLAALAGGVPLPQPTARAPARALEPPPLPDHYDEALGIGLESWPYPAPVRWYGCAAAGQPLRMGFMDVAPTGPARNRTAVLLHAKNFDSSYWAGPIRDLAAAGYRVVVPDQIGFHKSTKPDVAYTLDMLAELTINLLASQQINRFALVGHSTGGLLAVRIAAAYPERVEHLILEDPVGLVDVHRFVPAQSLDTLVAAERRRTVASTRAFVRSFFTVLPPAATEPFVEWRMRLALSGEYERWCRASALTYQMIHREPVRDQIDDIRAPTLMIAGEKDTTNPLKHYAAPDAASRMPSIPASVAEAAKDLRKGSTLIIPDVGHVPHLEAPDSFRKAMLDFLATPKA